MIEAIQIIKHKNNFNKEGFEMSNTWISKLKLISGKFQKQCGNK